MVEEARDEGGQGQPGQLLLEPAGGLGPGDGQPSPQPPGLPSDASQQPQPGPLGGQPELSLDQPPSQSPNGQEGGTHSQPPTQLEEVEEKKRHGILKHERTYSNKHVDFIEGVQYIPFDEEKDRTIEIQIVQEIRKVVSYRALIQKEKEEEEKKRKEEEEAKKRERAKGRRGGRAERGRGRGGVGGGGKEVENGTGEREDDSVGEAVDTKESVGVNEEIVIGRLEGAEATSSSENGLVEVDKGLSGSLGKAELEGSDLREAEGRTISEGEEGMSKLVQISDVSEVTKGGLVGVEDSEVRERSAISKPLEGSGAVGASEIGEPVEGNRNSRTENGLEVLSAAEISQEFELVDSVMAGLGVGEVLEESVEDQRRVAEMGNEESLKEASEVKGNREEIVPNDSGDVGFSEVSDSLGCVDIRHSLGMKAEEENRTSQISSIDNTVTEDNVPIGESAGKSCDDIVLKRKSSETGIATPESRLSEEIVVVSFL